MTFSCVLKKLCLYTQGWEQIINFHQELLEFLKNNPHFKEKSSLLLNKILMIYQELLINQEVSQPYIHIICVCARTHTFVNTLSVCVLHMYVNAQACIKSPLHILKKVCGGFCHANVSLLYTSYVNTQSRTHITHKD